MKKYFLTTALMGTFITPVFGADKIITSANTCTVDVLGVSDNNATANTIATWDLIDYTLNPGQYLNVTETSVDKTTCPAGSYCVGGGFTVETANNSIAQCPTTHPNSVAGAGADTQCYTACTVATANIAHATAVSGNDYFGDGADACAATACDMGYHVDGDIELIENDPLIPVDYMPAVNDGGYISADGNNTYQTTEYGLTANNTWALEFDYGVVYGRASCQPKADAGNEYIYSNLEGIMGGTIPMETVRSELTSLVGAGKAEVYMGFLEVELTGGEGMSEEEQLAAAKKYFAVGIATDGNYTTDSTGQYCYCQMDGFAPATDGVIGEKTSVTSAPWVFFRDGGSAGVCASHCAGSCAFGRRNDGVLDRAFRAAVFGALGTQMSGICTANTINIDWNPDNGGEHTKNMCTYDGSITLPTPDPVKPGYTFTGWKLVE